MNQPPRDAPPAHETGPSEERWGERPGAQQEPTRRDVPRAGDASSPRCLARPATSAAATRAVADAPAAPAAPARTMTLADLAELGRRAQPASAHFKSSPLPKKGASRAGAAVTGAGAPAPAIAPAKPPAPKVARLEPHRPAR